MSDDLIGMLQSVLGKMAPEKKSAVAAALKHVVAQKWLPNPGPQTDAYLSKADILLYGGAAGGGKSHLLLGLALTRHQHSVIFRRAYVDLRDMEEELLKLNGGSDGYRSDKMIYKKGNRLLEFGALEKPNAEKSQQGRRRDFMGFDEGAQISEDKVAFVLGWLASADPSQRSRCVIASNPPIGGEGDWLIIWFAPWLDPMFVNPAKPGELRWAITVGDPPQTIWVDGPGEYKLNGEKYEPGEWEDAPEPKPPRYTALSRTFIPAMLDDNPYLRDTDYRARIENMREPLRSQLLYGDFMAGRKDHAMQVIPTEWVKRAQARWMAAQQKRRAMVAFAVDMAWGGGDKITGSALHEDNWFAPIVEMEVTQDDPFEIAAWMVRNRRDQADLSVDATGGFGAGVMSHLKRQHDIECAGLVFSKGSKARAKDGKHTYKNLRSQMWYQFYEALDPDSGEDIMLPPGPRIVAHLTAPHYEVRGTDIILEDKKDIRKRLGSSPDEGDAIVMAWHRRNVIDRRTKSRELPGLPPPAPAGIRLPSNSRDGWMIGN